MFLIQGPKKINVVVFGSINIDIFLEVDRQPQIGETMSARKMTLGYGGKVIKQFLISKPKILGS